MVSALEPRPLRASARSAVYSGRVYLPVVNTVVNCVYHWSRPFTTGFHKRRRVGDAEIQGLGIKDQGLECGLGIGVPQHFSDFGSQGSIFKKLPASGSRFRVSGLRFSNLRIRGSLRYRMPPRLLFRFSGLRFLASGFRFRVWGFRFRVSGFRLRASSCRFRVSGVDFRVSGFVFRVAGFELNVSDFGFRVSDFGFWGSGFGFRVSGFELRLQVSGFGFRVSGFGFRASDFSSGFRFQVSGFGLRAEEIAVARVIELAKRGAKNVEG